VGKGERQGGKKKLKNLKKKDKEEKVV